MMKIDSKDFRVPKNAKIKLKKWPTKVKPCFESKEEYKCILEDHVHALSDLQRLLASDNHYALLLIFQGMDTAGKDGAIRHVMSGVNPQGCQVYSFKSPSSAELEHDFFGAPPANYQKKVELVFLIVPIMKKYLSSVSIPISSQIRICLKKLRIKKIFGRIDIALLLIWKSICIVTVQRSSNFSCIFLKMSSANGFWNESMLPKRIGN